MAYLEYLTIDPAQLSVGYSAMCHARQHAAAAFNAWLRERPDELDVQREIDAGASVLRQLAELEAGAR